MKKIFGHISNECCHTHTHTCVCSSARERIQLAGGRVTSEKSHRKPSRKGNEQQMICIQIERGGRGGWDWEKGEKDGKSFKCLGGRRTKKDVKKSFFFNWHLRRHLKGTLTVGLSVCVCVCVVKKISFGTGTQHWMFSSWESNCEHKCSCFLGKLKGKEFNFSFFGQKTVLINFD